MEYAVIDDEKATSSQVLVNIRVPCQLVQKLLFSTETNELYIDTSKYGKLLKIKYHIYVQVAVHTRMK